MFIVGVDLGQAQDYTAISIVERQVVDVTRRQNGKDELKKECQYLLRYLERPPLGTKYTAIVEQVIGLLDTPPLSRACPLVADMTGCGRPVLEMFTAAGVRPRGISITSGHEANTTNPCDMTVPKRDLAGTITAVYQGHRLKMAQGLALGETLIKEVLAFRPKINIATGNTSYEAWREKDHDDLVLSVALACWYGEHWRPRPFRTGCAGGALADYTPFEADFRRRMLAEQERGRAR